MRTAYCHDLPYLVYTLGGENETKEPRVELNNPGTTIHAAESHRRHSSRGTSAGGRNRPRTSYVGATRSEAILVLRPD